MPMRSREVSPGPTPRTVRADDGQILTVPADWVLLPPGDAGLTRRVKAAGPTWTVREKVGRKRFSRGVWTPSGPVEAARAALVAERATPRCAARRQRDAERRQQAQSDYVVEFRQAVLAYLRFHPRYSDLADRLADAVATHATPVGSGTVARTKRIPIEDRAAAAVIAWMRHRTTAYDHMTIARVKGRRRDVRRQFAAQSNRLLDVYRAGQDVDAATCPLARALASTSDSVA